MGGTPAEGNAMAYRIKHRRRYRATRRAGGLARSAKLTEAERTAAAQKAAQARWHSPAQQPHPAVEPAEFGDLLCTPVEDRMRLTIAEQQPETMLTAAGVEAVMRYWRKWLRERRQRQREQDVPLP